MRQSSAQATVLVVDDDLPFQEMLKAHLQECNYDVITCASGREALQVLEEQHALFDLAIFDVLMSDMDGITLTETVREHETLNSLPILLLTGLGAPDDIERGLRSGANDYMTKPFHPTELKARIQNLLRLQQFQRKLEQQYKVMQQDLEIARDLQLNLIPVSPMRTGVINLAWIYQPSSYVGGDMVNVFALTENHYGFYVADVSGHGVASAMLSTWLYHTLKPTMEQLSQLTPTTNKFTGLPLASPRSVAVLLDQMLSEKSSDHYLTMCYAIYHAPTQRFTYVRCGHPYPILITADGRCEILKEADGPAIGMSLGIRFVPHTHQLQPGDRLFFYSDALLEAMSADGEQFGLDQLCIELIASTHYSLDHQIEYILRAVQDYQNNEEFEDDVTLLGMEVPADLEPKNP
ncbi:MAG: response regulator [Deltaproteobacteria bacterium]|nr:MAG: response regulator [Deltaproteobacteria bacterium]